MRASGVAVLGFISLGQLVKAATITYNWTTTWVLANPDGKAVRPVIGINGEWPCPKIEATVGDYIVVNLQNNLGNETTGLHFHGINQVSTEDMDGPSGVTQCPVPPSSSIQYKFLVDVPGTYWYHSHNMGQYPDGLRGPLIVHDPNDPYKGQYDEEVILTVSDWYHTQSIDLVRTMLEPNNTFFLPPFPDNIIVNEGQGANIDFVKGKTYRIRIISMSAIAAAMIHFDSHTMQVIMNDASYVQQTQAYQLRIAPAQRYDVLISAIDRDRRNYPFLIAQDLNRDYAANPANNVWPQNFTGYLVMNKSQPLNAVDSVDAWRPVDDSHFLAYDNQSLFGPVTKTIVLNFTFCFFNGQPRACFNGQPYIAQKVPSLYTAATTNDSNSNPIVYGNVNPFVVNYGDVVQIVVNNQDAAIHPFHLHGHHYQILSRPKSGTGNWTGHVSTNSNTPTRRDTLTVNANSHAVLRYVANNPGVFLFHCHIEWHVEMGLTATIIEAPDRLRGITFPEDHISNCKLQNIPYSGNAGGNTKNFTDTSNYNTAFPSTYEGALYVPASKSRRLRHFRNHF